MSSYKKNTLPITIDPYTPPVTPSSPEHNSPQFQPNRNQSDHNQEHSNAKMTNNNISLIPNHYSNHYTSRYLQHKQFAYHSKKSELRAERNFEYSSYVTSLHEKVKEYSLQCQATRQIAHALLEVNKKLVQCINREGQKNIKQKGKQQQQTIPSTSQQSHDQQQLSKLIKESQKLEEKLSNFINPNKDHSGVEMLPQKSEQKSKQNDLSTAHTTNTSTSEGQTNLQEKPQQQHSWSQSKSKGYLLQDEQSSKTEDLQDEEETKHQNRPSKPLHQLLKTVENCSSLQLELYLKSSVEIKHFNEEIQRLIQTTGTGRHFLVKFELCPQNNKQHHNRIPNHLLYNQNKAKIQISYQKNGKYLEFTLPGQLYPNSKFYQQLQLKIQQTQQLSQQNMRKSIQQFPKAAIYSILSLMYEIILHHHNPNHHIAQLLFKLGIIYQRRNYFKESEKCFIFDLRVAEALMSKEGKPLKAWSLYRNVVIKWSQVKRAQGDEETAKQILRLINEHPNL